MSPRKNDAELLYAQMIGLTKEGTRKRRNLEIVWQALTDLGGQKVPDYSIARVGAKVEELGGPKTQSLRNKDGLHFRQLIESFARSSGMPVKKAPIHSLSQAEIAIEQLANVGSRVVLKMILEENRRLKSENDQLRHAFKSLSVDQTKSKVANKAAAETPNKSVREKLMQLDPTFIQASETFLGKEWLDEHHFGVEANGSIIAQQEGNLLMAPPGFANGLRRLIDAGQINSVAFDAASLRSFERFLSDDWIEERGWNLQCNGSIIDQTNGGVLVTPPGLANGLLIVVKFVKE